MNYEDTKKYIEKLDKTNSNKAFLDLVNYFKENNFVINEEEYKKLIDNYSFISHALNTLMSNEEFLELIQDNEYIICFMETYNEKLENNTYNDNYESPNDTEYEITTDSYDSSTKIFLKEMANYKPLSTEEFNDLFRKYKNGDKKAKKIISAHNIRLITSIAKKYMNSKHGLDLGDLIHEGYFGLDKAIEKFDPDKGYKFSTYATWWIKQTITRSISDTGNTMRLPVYINDTMTKIRKSKNKLIQELDHEPTIEDISKETGLSIDRIKEVMRLNQQAVYIDETISEDHETTRGEMMIDENAINPIEQLEIEDLKNIFKEIFNNNEIFHISDKAKQILIMRFGLEDGKARTLDEVGKHFNVTRERIRQIEARALRNLRSPKVAPLIANYYKEIGNEDILKYNAIQKRKQEIIEREKEKAKNLKLIKK